MQDNSVVRAAAALSFEGFLNYKAISSPQYSNDTYHGLNGIFRGLLENRGYDFYGPLDELTGIATVLRSLADITLNGFMVMAFLSFHC